MCTWFYYLFLDLYHLKEIEMLPCLTRLETSWPSDDTIVSYDCISSEFATHIFPFVFSYVHLETLTYILFSQTSLDYVLSMKTWQKQEYFLLSNANTFLDNFVLIECNFQVPFIVSMSFPIGLSTSSIPICQKNLYGKFKEDCKYDIKIQSKIIIVINVHCLKLYIQ